MNTDKKSIAVFVLIVLLMAFPLIEGLNLAEELEFQGKMEGTVWSCGWYTVRFEGNRLELSHERKKLQKTEYRIRETSSGVQIMPGKDWFSDGRSICEYELLMVHDSLILVKKNNSSGTGYYVLGKETT